MKNAHILIVEDDLDYAECLAEVVVSNGHTVQIALSGEEALDKFRQTEFDIILLDLKLPGINGVESFREFRKLKPDTKVVITTGYSVDDLVTQAQQEGALAVYHKPFELTKLMEFLAEL